MAILSDVGTVSYNGYTFDGASHLTIRVEPVMDEANRTVIYHRHTISIHGVIAAAAGTTIEMSLIRSLLSKTGGELLVVNRGFSTLAVNGAGGVKDVAFGPKPKIISWNPIGSLLAAEIEWECETCIAYCGLPVNATGVLAFNYSVDYALDYRGITTRSITGYLEIAANRTAVGATTISDTADAYRHLIAPTVPLRFKRTTSDFRVSVDKRRLDFTIVDSEINSPNPWPNGAVKVDAQHSVDWSISSKLAGMLRNTISVDIELAPDQPMLNAYAIFVQIANSRYNIAQAYYTNCALVEGVSCKENIFERTASFTLKYRITQTLKAILTSTGLWQPLTPNSWAAWRTSVATISGVRGYAGEQHLAANDAIVDICSGSSTIPFDYTSTALTQQAQTARSFFSNEAPPAANSWLAYDSHVAVWRSRAVVHQAVLQSPEINDPTYDQADTGGLNYPTVGGTDDIIQRSGRARYQASLVGYAARAGYPIPKPAVNTIGTAVAHESGGQFLQKIVGNWLGVPIYAATWDIVYDLENAPGLVLNQSNPEQEVTSGGTASFVGGP